MSVALDDGASTAGDDGAALNVQIFVPDYQLQKCLQVLLDEIVWELKQRVVALLPPDTAEPFNYGLFLPPCNGRAGKFLLEQRTLRDYPFQDCVPYLELKYKKRVYKMLAIDDKVLKQLHSKSSLKKFVEHVQKQEVEKVEKLLAQGLDPNFHDASGETPLTIAAAIPHSRRLMMALVNGGAHLDFRNIEGQTPMHRAAFLASQNNVKALLELGCSPNHRDPLGLTPLYYCMLRPDSCADTAELLLRDYAQLGVVDPHGNHEIHQACKNGLVKHLEHLLYYNAELDAQNRNGNTPLHVCAVNDRESCARVLLFRGADASLQNGQGQTALHVALVVCHPSVADVIRQHDPAQSVPHRNLPHYNSKRRFSTLSRGRSFSQSQASLNSSGDYGVVSRQPQGSGLPGASRKASVPSSPVSRDRPTLGFDARTMPVDMQRAVGRQLRRASATAVEPPSPPPAAAESSVRRFAPDQLASVMAAGNEVNTPRILVIPRGAKGFGFILRGAKQMEPGVSFEPTPAVPALQFFEGVDVSGMAMKAGLCPGDFLLEINGVDVRWASHDQVVALIQAANETITLKVITVDVDRLRGDHSEYTPRRAFGTMPNRRRARSTLPPPLPPQRDPSTSLSAARGVRYSTQIPPRFEDYRHQLSSAKSVESLPATAAGGSGYQNPRAIMQAGGGGGVPLRYADDERVASVRSRTSSRRISAAELEQLMARQVSTSSANEEEQHSPVSQQAPRKYASVADMKRRNQRPTALAAGLPRVPSTSHYADSAFVAPAAPAADRAPLKSFASSPNLRNNNGPSSLAAELDGRRLNASYHSAGHFEQDAADARDDVFFASPAQPAQRAVQRSSASTDSAGEYGRLPYRPTVRPKTPPPPPPPPPPSASQSTPPAAPPPPPVDMLRAPPSAVKADCRGITAEALTSVRLNKTPSKAPPQRPTDPTTTPPRSTPQFYLPQSDGSIKGALKQGLAQRSMDEEALAAASPAATPLANGRQPARAVDFNSDLRAALAKRRNQVDGSPTPSPPAAATPANKPQSCEGGKAPTAGNVVFSSAERSGLSLKESVRQSMPPKPPSKPFVNGAAQHSPPPVVMNGFAGKKDSGYTSSRTSLEPSECGDGMSVSRLGSRLEEEDEDGDELIPPSPDFPPPPPPEMLNASLNAPVGGGAVSNRVSILSQQLEDSFGGVAAPRLPKKPGAFATTVSVNTPPTQQRPVVAPKTLAVGGGGNGRREHDAVSVASTLSTLSGCSESASSSDRQRSPPLVIAVGGGAPPAPPPDYDDPDSGTGDSDHEPDSKQRVVQVGGGKDAFRGKRLADWSPADVADWLSSLDLGEYRQRFLAAQLNGAALLQCDRVLFTKLGVTRIGHRKAMEISLKDFATPK